MPAGPRAFLRRRREVAGRLKFTLEWILAVAGTVALAIAIWHYFQSGPETFPGEGKRVVAFRQVTNRICTENRENMHRALKDARSRVERLGYVARALGWDLNDLESITVPPTKFEGFLAELATRRQLRAEVLVLQEKIELGDRDQVSGAIANIEELETESRELSREVGIVRCIRAAPDARELTSG
jgi:hypothetical protein